MNRYLVTRSGLRVGSRLPATIFSIGPMLLSPALFFVGVAVGEAVTALGVALIIFSVLLFLVTVILLWVLLLTSGKRLTRATEHLMRGDTKTAAALCHLPLMMVFRADVRTRALYILGLAAEANADFADSADLFARAYSAVPAMAATKWKRHAQCLMLCHRAIALVAQKRIPEADEAVRQASILFPPIGPTGIVDALSDDVAFGAAGVSTALRDIEPGRDPRALLTLASALVLAAFGRGREALDLVDRERWFINAGLLPRERALVANLENRACRALAGGPMRSPGLVAAGGGADPWADRVLC